MIRRVFLTGVLAVSTVAGVFAQQNATFVLRDGERVSGTLSYQGGNDFKLNTSGRERSIPQSDIALIAFVPGDPAAAELNQLGSSGDELDRNTIVLRDGSIVRGKVYTISPDGRTVTINTTSSNRRDIPSDNIARIYMNTGAARSVYRDVISGAGASAPAAVATSGAAPGTITVNGTQPWTDTGITVKKGDRLSFQTSGQVGIASGNPPTGPDGAGGFSAPRNRYPVQQMPAGGLIGRVGNGPAFPIGSNSQPITMPANGRLSLGVNDDEFTDNSGAYTVTIVR